ncbi:Flagella basal body P-ring formation protein FlgA precursor|nr:Flagella basal body P-ring formation protein FlgA precursor [Candidatus Pantoea persica]
MQIREARAEEAERCSAIRNQAIRYGCRSSYSETVIATQTPKQMPASYRQTILDNPFFVAVDAQDCPVATGFLVPASGNVEAIFTLPAWSARDAGGLIIAAIVRETRRRGLSQLNLSSTPKRAAVLSAPRLQHGALRRL